MTGTRRAPVVRLTPARHSTRKKAVGLTEEERRILLAELAEIAAELDELQVRTCEIAARLRDAESSRGRRTGAA